MTDSKKKKKSSRYVIPWKAKEGIKRNGDLRNTNLSLNWRLKSEISSLGQGFVFLKNNSFAIKITAWSQGRWFQLQRLKQLHRRRWFVITALWENRKPIMLTMMTRWKQIRFAKYLRHRHEFQFSYFRFQRNPQNPNEFPKSENLNLLSLQEK